MKKRWSAVVSGVTCRRNACSSHRTPIKYGSKCLSRQRNRVIYQSGPRNILPYTKHIQDGKNKNQSHMTMKLTTPTALGVSAAVAKPLNPAAVAKPLAERCWILCLRNHSKSLDFCWDLPVHIAKHRYLYHLRPKYEFT